MDTPSHSPYRDPYRLDRGPQSDKSEFCAATPTADPTDCVLPRLPSEPSASQVSPSAELSGIDNLGEAGYRVLRPIPVVIRRVGIGNCEASFREANIAMSGSDSDDAFQALVAEILDTFDMLPQEQNLGPDAAKQLQVLRTYIAKA